MPSPFATLEMPKQQGKTRVFNHPVDWKPYKYKEPSKWKKHHFICYDGEGYDIRGMHEYVYLAAYDGEEYHEVRNDNGLGTIQCFNFLLRTSTQFKYGINVIYGGSYDANMMLKDVPRELLYKLHTEGNANWRNYRIEYIPRKYLQITSHATPTEKKKTVRLWDVIGFFQQSFVSALDTWLDIKDKTIDRGKRSRSSFNAKQLDFIIAYCQKELYLFEQLMQRLWNCLNDAGIKLNRWDGAGAASSYLLQEYGVYEFKGTAEQQAEFYYLARAAYAGGRFELFMPGDFQCKVYNYDINSAYPYGMSQLPAFTGLRKCRSKNHEGCNIGTYDLVKVEYEGRPASTMHPYFHRDHDYSVSYPIKHKGWHWAPEYQTACKHGNPGRILEHYRLSDTKSRPFHWVPTLYTKRRALKAIGDRAELALKLALNALYGKLVQQKGWKPGKSIPKSHQLYWGGWITSLTRAMIYDAMMQAPDSIIATETDGIFSLVELDLPISKEMGDWDVKIFDNLTYVQSGMYFGTLAEGYYNRPEDKEVVKYRGLTKGSLKRAHILKGWEKFNKGGPSTVKGTSNRFRTLGTSLVGERMGEWRQWRDDPKNINLLPSGKRLHNPLCSSHWGIDGRHTTISIQPREEESVPYNVLWEDTEDKLGLYEIMEEEWEGLIREN